jgi:hypothetical protein
LHWVTLGEARFSIVAEEIECPADNPLVEDAAVRAMAMWRRLSSSGLPLRLAIGRSRLLFERTRSRLIWMPSLAADEKELPVPERAKMPWDEALAELASRAPSLAEKMGS